MIRYLPPRLKTKLKRVARFFFRWFIAWLPYVMLCRLSGQLRALHAGVKMNWEGRGDLFNFRRSVHRLEKGLSFPSRRPVFAEDYICDTVDAFITGRNDPSFDSDTLEWGNAVLDRYFRVADHTPAIENAFQRYVQANQASTDPSMTPYPSNCRAESDVSVRGLLSLAKRRRSVRFFEEEPVPVEVVLRALEVGAQAPSACNRQAFQYLYFTEQEVVETLSEIPGGIAGYSVPGLIVVIARYRGYFDERDFKAPIIDASLSVMGFLLALETVGVSSVCINWPNHPKRERRLRSILDLAADEFVVMMIGVGYAMPEGLVPYSAKRPERDLLILNGRLKLR